MSLDSDQRKEYGSETRKGKDLAIFFCQFWEDDTAVLGDQQLDSVLLYLGSSNSDNLPCEMATLPLSSCAFLYGISHPDPRHRLMDDPAQRDHLMRLDWLYWVWIDRAQGVTVVAQWAKAPGIYGHVAGSIPAVTPRYCIIETINVLRSTKNKKKKRWSLNRR